VRGLFDIQKKCYNNICIFNILFIFVTNSMLKENIIITKD